MKTRGQFSVPWAILVIVVLGASFLWPRPRGEEQTAARPDSATGEVPPVIDTPVEDPRAPSGTAQPPGSDGSSNSPKPPPAAAEDQPPSPEPSAPALDEPMEYELAAADVTETAADVEIAKSGDAGADDEVVEPESSIAGDGVRGLTGAVSPTGDAVAPNSDRRVIAALPPKPSDDDGKRKPGKKADRDDRPKRNDDESDKVDRDKRAPSPPTEQSDSDGATKSS